MDLRPLIFLLALLPLSASAHFLELIPSTPLVNRASGGSLHLQLNFTHPQAAGPAMPMRRPVRFGVVVDGEEQPLDELLKADKCGAAVDCFQATYPVRAPATYRFFVEPAPYWERAEQKWIIHYTQVVVDAYDAGGDWATPLGLPVEILPLSRPYALWSGSSFSGVVLAEGEPVPFAPIEVEWHNHDGSKLPGGPYTTQQLTADANGTFHFTAPRPGWWGFAALVEGKPRPGPGKQTGETELGGLLWVHFRAME